MAGVYGSNLGFNVDQYGIRIGPDRAGQLNNYLQSPTGSGPSQLIPQSQNPNLSPAPQRPIEQPEEPPQVYKPAAPTSNIPANPWNGPINGTPAPAPQATPPTSGGGGGDYNAYLQGLMKTVSGYDPTAGINSAFDAQTQQALGAMGEQWTDQTGAMGRLPSDHTSQDLKAVLTGKTMAPIAAQRAAALAGAGQQGISNQMSLAGLLGQHQQSQAQLAAAQQQQAWQNQFQQNQFDYTKSADARNAAWQQTQFDYNKAWQQTQFDYTKTQQGLQNQGAGLTDAAGNFKPPQQQQAPQSTNAPAPWQAPGGGAFNTGGGLTSLADIWANANGGIPLSTQQPGMGGGAGLGSYGGGGGGGGDTTTPGAPPASWHLPGNAAKPSTPSGPAGNPNAGATPRGTFPTSQSSPFSSPSSAGAFASMPMTGTKPPGGFSYPTSAPRPPAPRPT